MRHFIFYDVTFWTLVFSFYAYTKRPKDEVKKTELSSNLKEREVFLLISVSISRFQYTITFQKYILRQLLAFIVPHVEIHQYWKHPAFEDILDHAKRLWKYDGSLDEITSWNFSKLSTHERYIKNNFIVLVSERTT